MGVCKYWGPWVKGVRDGYLCLGLQGLSVLFACVGSGDPVRVLRLYTMNTLDIF